MQYNTKKRNKALKNKIMNIYNLTSPYRQEPGMSPDGSIGPGAPQPNPMPSGADTGMYSPNPQPQRLILLLFLLIGLVMFITSYLGIT